MKSPPIVETCSSPEGDEAFANGTLARMKVIENINDRRQVSSLRKFIRSERNKNLFINEK